MTQQVQHVPGFLAWMLFGWSSLLAQCVNLDVRLYYATVQNLVDRRRNVPQTTAESSDTPPIHCAQHVQQSVDISIQLPEGLQYDPIQMTEVVQHEYVLVCWAWLYTRVNVENTVSVCPVEPEAPPNRFRPKPRVPSLVGHLTGTVTSASSVSR